MVRAVGAVSNGVERGGGRGRRPSRVWLAREACRGFPPSYHEPN